MNPPAPCRQTPRSPTRLPASAQSALTAYRFLVERVLGQGVSGVAIHAALVSEHGFTGHNSSVRRLIGAIGRDMPLDSTVRLTFEPGDASQVDFGPELDQHLVLVGGHLYWDVGLNLGQLIVLHVAARPAMISSDFARLIPTYSNSCRFDKSMVSKPHRITTGDSSPLNRWMVSIRTVVLPRTPSSSQVAGFGNGSLRKAV